MEMLTDNERAIIGRMERGNKILQVRKVRTLKLAKQRTKDVSYSYFVWMDSGACIADRRLTRLMRGGLVSRVGNSDVFALTTHS